MVSRDDISAALDSMILSASGWRGVFAAGGGEEDKTEKISEAHRIISAAAAFVFAQYLGESKPPLAAPRSALPAPQLVLVGRDTRPTGGAVAEAVIPVLSACGFDARYAGITAAPEIMAWARSRACEASGFIYISASHNPVGHNGIKFGLTDGGVLAAEETKKLIASFRLFFERDDCVKKIEELFSAADTMKLKEAYAAAAAAKTESKKAYFAFCGDVVWGGNDAAAAAVRESLEKRPLGIVCDFNGSARAVSIDRDFFSSLGLKFECINSEPGMIAHRIVPEGESLEPCRVFLEEAHARDASFVLGYVPDCDGDRGNLVIWDENAKMPRVLEARASKARALESQEVFALAVVAELSQLVWTDALSYDSGGTALSKAAIVVNDPTSLRIDRIAEAFGVSVFRAEVGEANVVGLARRLREEGYTVRILGEGSAGGNITHPCAVRDPINTVLAIVKLLTVRSTTAKSFPTPHSPFPTPQPGFEKPGLFEIWLKLSGQAEKYRGDFTLADVIESLPKFATTPAYSQEAVLRIKTEDHAILKDRYQEIFLREWERRKEQLKAEYGLCGWEAIAYNGMEEKRGLTRFGEAGRGGLKVSFRGGDGRETACIWMRGSATEPVFRIMADAQGADNRIENDLLNWQKYMIMEADTRG